MVQLSNSLSVRKELRTCIVDTLNELMKKKPQYRCVRK